MDFWIFVVVCRRLTTRQVFTQLISNLKLELVVVINVLEHIVYSCLEVLDLAVILSQTFPSICDQFLHLLLLRSQIVYQKPKIGIDFIETPQVLIHLIGLLP